MRVLKPLARPLYAPIVRRYRNRASMLARQEEIRREVAECLGAGRALKVIIGAGHTRYDGWIATDIPAFHVLKREHWARLFRPRSIERMLAEHVFEHMTMAELGEFLRLARGYLAVSGRIRIAVPDGNHPRGEYIARVRPGGCGEGAEDHKVLYDAEGIAEVITDCGYDYELLEYFDAGGQFQRREWHADDGFVGRSAEHDARNTEGELHYTSLIVDCWPE